MQRLVQHANSRVNEPHDTTQGLKILANSMANTNLFTSSLCALPPAIHLPGEERLCGSRGVGGLCR